MTTFLQIDDRTIAAEELIPLLTLYQIMPQFICESIIDRAIAIIECTPEEINQACEQFYQRWNLTTNDRRQTWQANYGLSQEHLELLATRSLRVQRFKQLMWGHQLELYFVERKSQLDRVIYSLIRAQDKELVNELYFRIQAGEQSFFELASSYSEGDEAKMGGLIGPVEFGKLPQDLADFLYKSQVGKVQFPIPWGPWQAILRVEALIPAKLDHVMRERLLQEKFQEWFQAQLRQLSARHKVWMGVL